MLRLHAIADFASTIPHLALVQIGQPFDIAWEDIDAGSLNAPAYRKINPLGLIPSMETPDGPMFETGAIMHYLMDRHPGALGPGPGDAGRAGFLSWLWFTANTLHPLAMQIVHPERVAGEAASVEVGRASAAQFADRLSYFEAALAADTTLGHLAIAFYVAVLVRWVQIFAANPADRLDLGPFPAVRALLARVEAMPASRKVAQIEGIGDTPFTAPKG